MNEDEDEVLTIADKLLEGYSAGTPPNLDEGDEECIENAMGDGPYFEMRGAPYTMSKEGKRKVHASICAALRHQAPGVEVLDIKSILRDPDGTPIPKRHRGKLVALEN